MPLRNWSKERIRRLWIGGVVLESALVLIPIAFGALGWLTSQRTEASLTDSLFGHPLTAAQLDSFSRRAHAALDSLGARLDTNGDSPQ
jgi:hypothetical protein